MRFLSIVVMAACGPFLGLNAWSSPQTVQPGESWLDDRGQPIQAHGGGVIKLGDTYYWFGEDRSKNNDPKRRYVACYSSIDLVHWKFRHQVVQADDVAGLGAGWVLERPKVFYNAKTCTYVMYAHLDQGYKLARVAVFTCTTIDGDYQYVKNFRPLGQQSRDIGQFIDDDGSAYLIFEDRANGFHIAKLSDDDMDVVKDMHLFTKEEGGKLEGGALVHYRGLYYVIGSQMTGWRPNPNVYATAPNLEGPWSSFRNIAPPETNTYGAQSTMLLKITGTKTTSVVFMGDIWKPKDQWDSRYLWMPLKIDNGELKLPAPKPWMVDVTTGETALLP